MAQTPLNLPRHLTAWVALSLITSAIAGLQGYLSPTGLQGLLSCILSSLAGGHCLPCWLGATLLAHLVSAQHWIAPVATMIAVFARQSLVPAHSR